MKTERPDLSWNVGDQMTRGIAVCGLVVLGVMFGAGSARAQSDVCARAIKFAADQRASGDFALAETTLGSIKMGGCTGDQETCEKIFTMRTDVTNSKGPGWKERAAFYLKLWTEIQCKPHRAT